MADASDVSAEADLRLVAVIAELEAAAGEPAYANPGLGLVARVIVYGCRHTFDRQGMALFIQRKPWMREVIHELIEKYRVDQAERTGMFAAVDPGAGSWGAGAGPGAGMSWNRMSWGCWRVLGCSWGSPCVLYPEGECALLLVLLVTGGEAPVRAPVHALWFAR